MLKNKVGRVHNLRPINLKKICDATQGGGSVLILEGEGRLVGTLIQLDKKKDN